MRALSYSGQTLLCALALTLVQSVSAQSPVFLKQGEPVSGQIKGGESRVFLVSVEANKYLRLHVEQQGIILSAKLTPPPGSGDAVELDYPCGGFGPIYLSAISSSAGNYQLEILADKGANPASFEVVLDEVRSSRPEDQTVIDAQQAFAEGRKIWTNNAAGAVPHYERALSLWTTANDERSQALTLFALNQAYSAIGRQERPKAINRLETLLAIVNQRLAPNDWRIKAAALNDLGSHRTLAGEAQLGIDLLKQAYDLFSSHQDRRGQASSLNNLAIAYGRIGNLSLARDSIQQALPLRYAENDQAGAINLINSLGAVSYRLGEPDKALEYFEQAVQEWQKLGELSASDRGRVASLLQNLAVASDQLGQWEKARDYYDRALAMYSAGDDARPVALDNKGDLYATLGDLKKAREYYDEALAILPPEKFDPDLKAGILVHLGQLFSLQSDLTNAVNSFQQARDLKPNPPKLADVLTNLAVAYAAQGKLEEAMAAYNQALAIQLELKDKRGQALTLQKRGETYNLLKQNPQALEDLNRAVVLWESLKDSRGRAATLNALARVEQDRGNLKDALKHSDEVISIVESQRTTLSSRQLRVSYFATQENYYELNIDLNMQLGKSEGAEYVARAFATAEKARARVLLEALREAGVDRVESDKTSHSQLSSLLDQLRTTKVKLAAKAQARTRFLNTNANATQLATLDKEIDALSEKSDSLEAQVRSQHPRFATLTKPQPTTLKVTQQQLDDDTLMLEYALGSQRSYVWAVSQNSIDGFELGPRDKIEQAARRVTDALNRVSQSQQEKLGIEKQFSDASTELSKLVLERVAPLLGNKRLVVVADGTLQLVPFAALPVGNSPLVAQHEIVYLPSASVLTVQRLELANRKPAALAVAILANPVYGVDDERVSSARKKKPEGAPQVESAAGRNGSRNLKNALRNAGIDRLDRLPHSYDEALAIMNVVPKGEYFTALGFEANRTTAMSRVLSKYRVIHFATHGILNLENPELSGIVFSLVDKDGEPQDGYLFLHDIYNLDLPAELVVLSACQTGVGKEVKGEGLMALTRGFMYAGAARLVASLWKVDDAATAKLMAQFYKEMFTNGKKPAAALQAAQLHMRKQPRWNSPVYWAGFFIQGEWR